MPPSQQSAHLESLLENKQLFLEWNFGIFMEFDLANFWMLKGSGWNSCESTEVTLA